MSLFIDSIRGEKIKKIWDSLQDKQSKDLYLSRSLYSLTGEDDYLVSQIRNMSVARELTKYIRDNSFKKKVIFGAGTWGQAIIRYFSEFKWACCYDNYSSLKKIGDVPVYKFNNDEVMVDNTIVVVALYFKWEEIKQQLIQAGFDEKNIFCCGEVTERLQYFDLPQLTYSEDEIFVDIGGYNGASTRAFVKWCGGTYRKVYVFEPGEKEYELCLRGLSGYKNCDVVNLGVWKESGMMSFCDDGESSYLDHTDSNAMKSVNVVSIDDFFVKDKVSFIKMDIEGAEAAAIDGGKNIIKRDRPQLAISIYHKREDIWDLPNRLLELVPDYRFYIRAYSFTGNDVVLYAI